MEIQFFNAPPLLRSRTRLKGFITNIFKGHKVNRDYLNIIFCSDNEILKINKEFLNHDYFTDIITFDFPEETNAFSEIYISIDRVKNNAKRLGVSSTAEIHRVIFHGVLHILGFLDKSTTEKIRMTREEDKLLKSYF